MGMDVMRKIRLARMGSLVTVHQLPFSEPEDIVGNLWGSQDLVCPLTAVGSRGEPVHSGMYRSTDTGPASAVTRLSSGTSGR